MGAHPLGQGPSAAGLRAARRPRQDRARDELADRKRGLGRGALQAAARSRALHDRRGRRLQHGRDGEQGPEHLQHEVRSGQPRDRDRRRLHRDRKRRRPRILSQLDRQPHHLPRLVPAEPEGRPDRLSRSGIQHGHGRQRVGARGQAHRRRARAASGSVLRRRGPDGAPGAPRQLRANQQLLHRNRLRKRRRGGADDADPRRPRRLRQRHDAVLRASRRPRSDLRRFRAGDRRCEPAERARAAVAAVQALVQPGRHAARDRARPLRRADAHLHLAARAKLRRGQWPVGQAALCDPDGDGPRDPRRPGPRAAARR